MMQASPALFLSSVIIETFSCFAAKFAGVYLLLLDATRTELRLIIERTVYRPRNSEVCVDADKIHQLKWPHAESCTAHKFVDRGKVGDTFFGDLQRLNVIQTCNA